MSLFQLDQVVADTPLNPDDPLHRAAAEYWAAIRLLDERGVPREREGKPLSLAERIDGIVPSEPAVWMVFDVDGVSRYITADPTGIEPGQRALGLFPYPLA